MPNHTELLDLLLKNRGIAPADYDKFLNPSYEDHTYDPYLMHDMQKACVRIYEATEAGEKIVIYSDYDCDGIPAAVIMHDFFKKIKYENFSIYIPDRHSEGYGLNSDAIDKFINEKVDLLITFDLGITAVAEVTNAQSAGIDVIITDHHLPHEVVPPAFAILNPKQIGCNYPDKMLCGAGLAFKLVQALVIKYGEYWNIQKGWEKWLLDMAGVATLSDQVPLLDENRVLAYYGLKVLKKNHRAGLQQFWRSAKLDISNLVEDDITFTLAPKINAASRMDSPMRAFELLATTDITEAGVLTKHLMKLSDERKYTVAQIMKEVNKVMAKREQRSVVVIGNPSWRVGVLGIVASKIVDEYKKPAFVWGMEGADVIKGSCRGYGNLNLVDLMSALPEGSLIEHGGHAMAGGFAVSHEEVHFLEERLVEAHKTFAMDGEVVSPYNVEADISIDDVTNDNYKVIESMAPYGVGNPKPVFMFRNVPVNSVKEFGKEANHLEVTFMNEMGRIVKAIAFFKTRDSYDSKITAGSRVNLIATFEKSTFAGRTELRLRIVDIV